MLHLYLDTLVFGLQKMGGVSVVWIEYIKRMLKDSRIDLTLLDIQGEYVNFIYKEMDTREAKHIQEHRKNLQLLRNIRPKFPIPKKTVLFQSTYLRTCRRKNVRNVIMVHDITHQLYGKGIKKWLNTHQKKKSIRNADGMICVSQNTLDDLHRIFPQSQKLKSTVVYNSASEDYCVLDEYELDDAYKILKDKKYFIYVGDRYQYKNPYFLYDVLKVRPDLTCVLIGGKALSVEEKDYLGSDEERVLRFTKVPNAELNKMYNQALCLIYPSLYEGFGIPVLEAMRAGCPVIAFNNSSIPEVLHGSGILLKNNDLSGCLKALRQLEDPLFRNQIIDDQLKASEFFSWEKSYEKLIRFYDDVLNGDQ